jgi:hypothetical protein
MNPTIELHQAGAKTIKVVRDDLLVGGTKQAAIMSIIDGMQSHELVYASPRQGYAQIAVAAACKAVGKRAVLFVAASNQLHDRTRKAQQLGSQIHQVPFGYLSVVQSRARKYCADHGAELLPFGLNQPAMIEAIAARALSLSITPPQEVWSVAGSGTLQKGLQMAWPDAAFFAVQIGKQPDAGKAQIIVAPERYEQSAKIKPPFPSCDNYDAKAWQFIVKSASDGALFWNVAS